MGDGVFAPSMEVSALTHPSSITGLRGPSALLRLQSDERLISMTRRGQSAAFETLCARYQSRLMSFCRHMLGSREDAEDVLQEVFAAAFNAVLADDREINVRPWLYRIARNRSLNHLRRTAAIGVDTMDVHFAEHGVSTSDKVLRRESFRELLSDVRDLPETQRTALLLREIDALSYEQIAQAMETTVPSVKSLLVRARISLAEAAEARKLSCEEVRLELGEVAEGLTKLSTPARRHVRGCERCAFFKKQLRANNRALAAILPVGPLVLVKQLLLAKLGSASAGGAHVAGGAGVTVGAGATATVGAGAAASGGAGFAGGLVTAGAGAIATKAAAGLAAAALVTAGAVATDHTIAVHHHHRPSTVRTASTYASTEPVVVSRVKAQPASASASSRRAALARHRARLAAMQAAKEKAAAAAAAAAVPAATTTTPATAETPAETAGETQVTEVTSDTTPLPPQATGEPTAGTPPATTTGETPQPTTTPTTTTPQPPLPTAEPVPPAPPSLPTAEPVPPQSVVAPSTGAVAGTSSSRHRTAHTAHQARRDRTR
jgi:RNA polymerase sigma factor (sigma-70 family)